MKRIQKTQEKIIPIQQLPNLKEWDKEIIHFDYEFKSEYISAGIIPIEPMTAKEIMEKDVEEVFNSDDYIVEEKFDGVRANVQFVEDKGIPCCRVFSRRKSAVTGFYKEKSDNLPQIRNIHIPELTGTILDGEMIIPNTDFKTTSAVLNCLPAEAIERQQSIGKVCFYTFDCLYFKGKNIMNLPLKERKKYLKEVLDILYNYGYDENIKLVIPHSIIEDGLDYYRRVIARGGEGIMIKDLNAPYEMKRTRAYQKMKKKFTRDVVILGFAEPTKEYTGKFPNDKWDYWYDDASNKVIKPVNVSASELLEEGYTPVTKNWYENKVGAIIYGVKASKEMLELIEKGEYSTLTVPPYGNPYSLKLNGKQFYLKTIDFEYYVIVGECEGITDEERENFTNNKDYYCGKVIEVECNEIFKDTGKLRHPRFLRVRLDKNIEDCTWEAHING